MKQRIARIIFVPLLLLPALGFAHAGYHGQSFSGFGAGMLHPLLGLDHLLAMLGIGSWAQQQNDRGVSRAVLLTFVAMLLVGFGFGLGSSPVYLFELGIAGSVAFVGTLVFFNKQLSTPVASVLVGLFAMVHGHAHGTEMTKGLSALEFGIGFLIASALILSTGAMLWKIANRYEVQVYFSRCASVTLLVAGGMFLMAM